MSGNRITVSNNVETRVGLLERDVAEIRTSVLGLASDVKAGFAAVSESFNKAQEAAITNAGKTQRPLNWYAILASVAATATVIGSLFTLAEWRIGVAIQPMQDRFAEDTRVLQALHGDIGAVQDQLVKMGLQNVQTAEQLKANVDLDNRLITQFQLLRDKVNEIDKEVAVNKAHQDDGDHLFELFRTRTTNWMSAHEPPVNFTSGTAAPQAQLIPTK